MVFAIKEGTKKIEAAKEKGKEITMGVREFQISDRNVVIHELDDLYDSTTGRVLTGSWVWNSAFVLAEWMATQCKLFDFDFRDKTVIELGAGAGLPGLMAALLGARRVVLTDVEPLLPGLLRNVDANGLEDRVEVRELVWGLDESVSRANEFGEFDLILMSDLFYDSEDMAPLAHILKIISGKHSKIWAASEIRPWTVECLTEFTNEGFKVEESQVQLDEPREEDDDHTILDSFSIFHLQPPDEERNS
ncbi:protein N-lysine methyltransferase METTL21A-like [Cucurbita pepo subsp. pepo]|uniref:protein N-lysine methyltransferase METTL21A-like n=1 Tax=Cucurbita pepo subsp. pepo TaxID=3664 RepID=UPI000C9D5B76|nr:protein N-lysine methyltransferase METTL21A-like [Cucurbita pepo subsp. pepo]